MVIAARWNQTGSISGIWIFKGRKVEEAADIPERVHKIQGPGSLQVIDYEETVVIREVGTGEECQAGRERDNLSYSTR